MAESLTIAMKRALAGLQDANGEGAVGRGGYVVAAGERLTTTAPETWLRLFTMGLVEAAGVNRLRITAAGREAVPPLMRKVRPETIHAASDSRVEAKPGAE